jgi:predicted component of type VI protein secretion system
MDIAEEAASVLCCVIGRVVGAARERNDTLFKRNRAWKEGGSAEIALRRP